MSSNYYMRNRAETINEIRTARRPVLARLTVESTMGPGESQIGYLSNDITLHGEDAHWPALTHRRRVVACKSRVVGRGKLILGTGSRQNSIVILIAYPTLMESLPMIRGSMRDFSQVKSSTPSVSVA